MSMERDYQYSYSQLKPSLFNTDKRVLKAETIIRVCQDYLKRQDLSSLHLLDVGSSNGIIDNHLAKHFGRVSGIDIDEPAMAHAKATFARDNLEFKHGDAMDIRVADNSIDVVVCTQIYEHVPSAQTLFREIHRILKPGGFCYFSGNNRLMLMEPHYQLPLLSVVPRALAHRYVKFAGKADYYHEKHYSWWTLRRLCRQFDIVDYSAKVVADPDKFAIAYMLRKHSAAWQAARLISRYARWAAPMMWILQKRSAH
jgi:2-polyprenyl-3-methyl-5-hydroxy-6-metoxy-1,4-benzoquinol methylase